MRFWKIHSGALMRKSLAIATVLSVFITWKTFQNMQNGVDPRPDTITFPVQSCKGINTNKDSSIISPRIMFFNSSATVNKRVLILSKRAVVYNVRDLLPILEGKRILYDIHYLAGGDKDLLPSLTEQDRGKYVAIIFTSFSYYFGLSLWNRHLLDNYCHAFGVGMILFNLGESSGTSPNTEWFPFKIYTSALQFKLYHVAKNATILRLVKGNNVLDSEGKFDLHKWSIFVPQSGTNFIQDFEVIATSNFNDETIENKIGISDDPKGFPVVIHDLGKRDNIHRVYFGADLTFWPHKLLFLDALSFVSQHKLAKPLDRWIQVDIDDIFVGRTGIRMKKEDVKASIVSCSLQNAAREWVKNKGKDKKSPIKRTNRLGRFYRLADKYQVFLKANIAKPRKPTEELYITICSCNIM
jgi:hypothetical protein